MTDQAKELKNSRRLFYKAPYTPVRTRERDMGEAGDAVSATREWQSHRGSSPAHRPIPAATSEPPTIGSF